MNGFWARPITGYADANGDGILVESEITSDTAFHYVGPPLPTKELALTSTFGFFRDNLQHEAIMGALLAVAVILIFLGSGTSTLIIAHSIPISIIATFVLLHLGKFTLNIMTLGGLALGVGRLVDDAIVVLENINRHIEMGDSPTDFIQRSERG